MVVRRGAPDEFSIKSLDNVEFGELVQAQGDLFDRLDVVLGDAKVVGSLSGTDGPRLDLARVAGVAGRGEGEGLGRDGAGEG